MLRNGTQHDTNLVADPELLTKFLSPSELLGGWVMSFEA